MQTNTIYKICAENEWAAALQAGVYKGSEADLKDGFIHFSTGPQAVETARKHFAGVEGQQRLGVIVVIRVHGTHQTQLIGDAADVWRALTDWPRAPEWMNGIDSMAADGPLAVGTELTFRARGKDRHSEIADLDPGHSVTLRSRQGGVSADYTYTVESTGDGRSRLSLVAECRPGGLWRLYGPLLKWMIRRTDGGQPAALKALVESETLESETPKETP